LAPADFIGSCRLRVTNSQLCGEVITGEGRVQKFVTQLRISVLDIGHNLFLSY
jgi:hypothetical protein